MNRLLPRSVSRIATTRLRNYTRVPTGSVVRRRGQQQHQHQLRNKSATAAVEAETAQQSAATAAKTSKQQGDTAGVPIIKSLLAAAVGVGTVAAVAATVENATAESVPPYDPQGQRFDQSNFYGRFCKMVLACDPRLLSYTEAQVRSAQEMLRDWQKYAGAGREQDRALWEARRITEAALHPDTGEVVPRPFRMSGYVPFNGPVCVAMVASPGTMSLLFWSWVNQSQNALVNYYNRNASSPMTNATLAASYGAAVSSALVVAFGASQFIQKRYSAQQAKQMLRFAAFPSAVVASSLNCFIVRSPELKTGVPLMNEDQTDVLPGETSQAAAAVGVYSTTASRALLQAPVYFVPPVLMSAVPAIRNYVAANPAMAVPITTYLVLVSFGVGLPGTVAIFPQVSAISATKVEERFQHLRDPKTNQPYDTYYFNKGL